MVAAERGQSAVLRPARGELGAGAVHEGGDVTADESLTRDAHTGRHGYAHRQVRPLCAIVAQPLRSVTLYPGEACSTQDEGPQRGLRREQAFVRGHRHEQAVLIVKALVRMILPVAIEAH